ncbi:protein C12orf4 homolog [Corticium candelabrum]|uniref:protein C12orf4 homolog n=1 Tax=Corticium candelabrum TaxID=121492 RepID=UPI002E26EDA1|nr:protein C12orf4 homolog [Corticium candelabrum]
MESGDLSLASTPTGGSRRVSLTPPRLIEQFDYNFTNGASTKILKVPLPVPIPGGAREFAERLITFNRLPVYVHDDLIERLTAFQRSVVTQRADEAADATLEDVRMSDKSLEERVDEWADLFASEHAFCAVDSRPSDELSFADAYHSLIHSPALGTLLKLEQTYAMDMQQENEKKEMAMKKLELKHEAAMQNTLSNLGMFHSDQDVTMLAGSHLQEIESVNAKWQKAIDHLRTTQRHGYREFVMSVQEERTNEYPNGRLALSSPKSTPDLGTVGNVVPGGRLQEPESESSHEDNRYEESFTIYLGTQLKTIHNLRLLSCDVLDLCRHKVSTGSLAFGTPDPQRLQMAMSLYSTSLSGLVLLVDNRISSYSGIKKQFAAVCEQSTDFHFPSLNDQLEKIRIDVRKGKQQQEERKKAAAEEMDEVVEATDMAFGMPASPKRTGSEQDGPLMSPGDYYITKHSNLAEVHVVFHLVVDDSIRQSTMNSRHRCLSGLRSLLHTASRCDIKTLTIPLLFVYEMSEEMTVNWCLRRAELIFKCVKGYMIECSTWAGNEPITIQFLVPQDLSQDLFEQFSAMVPNIFQLSNPLNLGGKRNRTYSAYA